MLVLLFVALWFILRGNLFYVLPCVILFLRFAVLLALRLPRLGKRELILVLFVRLFDLCLFGFVGFLFLLVSGKGCGLWYWHSLDFSLTLVLFIILCTISAEEYEYSSILVKQTKSTALSNKQRWFRNCNRVGMVPKWDTEWGWEWSVYKVRGINSPI